MTTYLYGYSGARLSLVQMETRSMWANLHPEFRRRLVALFDASQAAKHEVGIGGGWRSDAQQRALFLRRYDVAPCPADWKYDGKCWKKKPGVAQAAPPGRSYHETTITPQGNWALAADLVGDLAWMKTRAAGYGLVEFSNIGELWHVQPTEIPRGRAAYRGESLKTWPLPTPKPPQPVPPYPGPPPVKRGSKGPNVVLVQSVVGATPDGDFGPATERRVKAWQQRNNLKPDGIVGPITWRAMFPPREETS